MEKLLLSALIIFLCSAPALLQDPCVTHAILAGPATRSSEHVQNTTDLQMTFCDISLTPGWYRLQVNNEDADLATSPPPPGACNTFYPIWINDEIPVALNQEVQVTACIVSTEDTPCAIELQAKIINCGTYRVYNLQPPTLCPSAYCFDLVAPCPVGTSSETGLEPGCSDAFPQVIIKPIVTPLLGMSTEDANFEDLRFNCDFPDKDPGYFYDVVWRINGDEVTRISKQKGSDLPESGQLIETAWKHQYKLGMNVQCSVRVRSSENGVPSPEHHSDEFFAGLRVLDEPAVELTEGETATIRYQATVPVPCRKKFVCSVAFKDFSNEEINGVCKRKEIPGECGFNVLSSNWNAIHELKVTAEYDGMYGGRLAEIFLKGINPVLNGPQNVWADVTPPVVHVNIHDLNANYANSKCSIVSDPHFKSFDGRTFDVHLPGEFVLYRHKTLPLEVRGFFQKCGSTAPPYCVCGGAVRSGRQLFVYSFCRDNVAYQTTRVRVFGCNQNQMRVTSLHNGRDYQITLPNGMTVYIGLHRIYINPSPSDVGQAMGLCGTFNGDKDDDLTDPNGMQHSDECDFLFLNRFCVVNNYGSTWRVEDQAKSFYSYPDLDLGPNPVGRCSCTSPVPGLPTQNVDCTNVPSPQCDTLDPEVTSQYCTQLSESSSGRRRRQANLDDGLIFDDIKHILPTQPDVEFPTFEWINGWNQGNAEDFCSQFFRRSPAFLPCSKVNNLDLDDLLDFCVVDILLTGTTDWAIAALELYKLQCATEVRRNTTLWRAEGGRLSVFDQVIHANCPNECSFHGTCVQGECQCDVGWIGDDCSTDLNQTTSVTGLPRRGLCDLRNRKCDRTLVYGTQFARSDSLSCKFEQVFFKNKRTILVTDNTFITKATFRHSAEIVCSLPPGAPLGTSEDGAPFGYYVSVSNDNNVYGEAQIFLPFNSENFNCVINDGCGSCRKVKKPKTKKPKTKKPKTKKPKTKIPKTKKPKTQKPKTPNIPDKNRIPYLEWVAKVCGNAKTWSSRPGKGWGRNWKSWLCSRARWIAETTEE